MSADKLLFLQLLTVHVIIQSMIIVMMIYTFQQMLGVCAIRFMLPVHLQNSQHFLDARADGVMVSKHPVASRVKSAVLATEDATFICAVAAS